MSVIIMKMPRPPQGLGWCVVCACLYKGRVVAHHQEELTAIDRDGLDGTVEFVPDKNADYGMLEPAVTWSKWVGMEAHFPVPVLTCWSHVMPVNIQVSGVLPMPAGSEEMIAQQLQQMGAKVIGAPKGPRQRESHFPNRTGG